MEVSIESGFKFVLRVFRFFFIFIYDILIIIFWLITSNIAKLFIKFDRSSDKLKYNTYSQIHFWRCQEYTNLLIPVESNAYRQTYIGNNVNDLLFEWITLDLGLAPNVISYSQIMNFNNINRNSIVVTVISNNLKNLRFFIYLFRIYICAKKLRKLGIPVVCFLPDSFFPDAAIISVILTTLTRGTVIIPQNSKDELIRFGFPRVGQSLFWTYPQSRRKKLITDPIIQKRDVILVAKNSSGGGKRNLLISAVSRNFAANGYHVIETNGSYSQDEYENLVRESKFIATTNYVQDGFFYGPRLYRKRISLETITGRTWDAFASRSLLITNPTEALSGLGFLAGSHFLDISLFTGDTILEIPPDDKILEITQRSFDLFLELGSNKKFI